MASCKEQQQIIDLFAITNSLPYFDHQKIQLDFPNMLYHYTSVESMLSIIQAKTFHVSHILFLNDTKELHYGRKLISEYLKSNAINFKFRRTLAKVFNEIDTKESNHEEYFSVSFTQEKDNLTLWRLYGNNCKGCCIEIDHNKFSEETNIPLKTIYNQILNDTSVKYKFHIHKVCYDEQIQKDIIHNYLLKIEDWRKITNFKSLKFNHFLPAIAKRLDSLAIFFKSKEFADEKEVRLLVDVPQPEGITRFKVNNNIIKPYIELKGASNNRIPNLPNFISSIILGPNSNKQHLKVALSMLLKQNNYSPNTNAIISESGISPLSL